MTNPSPLGEAIEVAIETGRVFAVERVTLSQITLWLPEGETVRVTAEKEGLTVTKSVPYSDSSRPHQYGRISSLNSVPELRDASLYRTAIASVDQATAVLGALT